MNVRMIAVALAATLTTALALADIRAVSPVPQSADPDGWWMKRFAGKQKLVREGGSKVVFIGDSITHFWDGAGRMQWERYFAGEPYRALNLGFSADRTEHVLWRIDNGELDGYEAKVVVLMIGTNNTGHFSEEQEPVCDTIIGIRAVLDRIRAKQPKSKVVLCAIFPRGRDATDANRRRNDVVNKEVQRFADGKTVFWCDFTGQFLKTDGTLPAEMFPDRLHPADTGYEIWASAVLPYVHAAVNDLPMPPNRLADHPSDAYYVDGARPVQARSLIGRRLHWWRTPEVWWDALKGHREAISKVTNIVDLVLLGDSITGGWPFAGGKVLAGLRKDYTVLPLGLGGDCVENVIWRARYGELAGYRTRYVAVMIGTNNNYGDRAEDTAAGIGVLLKEIRLRQPQATVLLMPIFPRGETAADKLRLNNEKVNAMIRGYVDGKTVLWLDIRDRLMNADGTISKELMPDFLHPKEEGYRIWADALRPYLEKKDATK